ncbi:MAG: metallophosphoesterase [Pseudomonadales bacterium]
MLYRVRPLQRLGLSVVTALFWLSALPAHAAAALSATPENRIVAFGDVHGALAELEALLEALDLIDGQGNWIGGHTRLVSLGDLLDRGPDSRGVMDLLMTLERQAAAAGGAVHVVLGNHEIMNLTGDLRYVSPAEYAAFAADEDPAVRAAARADYLARAQARAASEVAREADSGVQSPDAGPEDPAVAFDRDFPPGYFAHRAAFSREGAYGRWLLGKPQVLALDRIAFVHGGLSRSFASLPIDAYNTRATAELEQLLALGERLSASGVIEPWQDYLSARGAAPESVLPEELTALRASLQFADDGPSWYRGTAACHPLIETPRFEAMLEGRGFTHVVMGHTPTFPRIIQTRFDGRAVLADTGTYAAYYRGRPAAAVFGGGEPVFLSLDAAGELIQRSGHPAIDVRAAGSPALLQTLEDRLADARPPADAKPLVLEVDGRRQLAWYRPGNRRQINQQLAAQALDRLLGLGLVAPVVQPTGSNRGLYEIMPAASFSEAERVASSRYRPNWCAGGSDYDLMYVLDVLLGVDFRTGETLHYDPATWLIYLTGHQEAFPTWQRLPSYLTDRQVTVPPLLAERLAKLSADTLEHALGGFLNNRQRNAVLARRDLILGGWPLGS